jgi:hypothetical protein
MKSKQLSNTCGALFLASVLAACGAPETVAGSCTLRLPAGAGDEEAITAVIRAEGQLVVNQQIDPLMELWAPGDEEDDQYWRDKDAIRHRYVRTVFPGAPQQAAPADLNIALNGDQASVVATTHIGDEVSPAGDRWTLVKRGNCWLLQNLTYNLESQP